MCLLRMPWRTRLAKIRGRDLGAEAVATGAALRNLERLAMERDHTMIGRRSTGEGIAHRPDLITKLVLRKSITE